MFATRLTGISHPTSGHFSHCFQEPYFDGDWNGGCDGPVSYDGVGTGSARYYERGRLHRSIVAELLMCGISDADTTTEGRDLSFGPVFGIGTDGLKYKVDCGAFNDLGRDNVRSPTHQ